jgi:hypothetical protein
MVRNPLPWLKDTLAPVRRFVTLLTRYPPSRTLTELPEDGLVTTWTYCWVASPFFTVVYP